MPSSSNASGADNDAVLISRAMQGDGDGFGVLYERYLEAIYRYVFYRVGHVTVAEDLTEEVFVRAWEALPKYKQGEHRFSSWLYRIAHNLVVDFHRKHQPEAMSPLEIDARQTGEPLPEQAVIGQQESAELAWAIGQLDEMEQQVIVLRFVEGLSHREVAEIIDSSEGASRVTQHRALAKLHVLLSGQEKPNG